MSIEQASGVAGACPRSIIENRARQDEDPESDGQFEQQVTRRGRVYSHGIDKNGKPKETDHDIKHPMVYMRTNETIAVVGPVLVVLGFVGKFSKGKSLKVVRKDLLSLWSVERTVVGGVFVVEVRVTSESV